MKAAGSLAEFALSGLSARYRDGADCTESTRPVKDPCQTDGRCLRDNSYERRVVGAPEVSGPRSVELGNGDNIAQRTYRANSAPAAYQTQVLVCCSPKPDSARAVKVCRSSPHPVAHKGAQSLWLSPCHPWIRALGCKAEIQALSPTDNLTRDSRKAPSGTLSTGLHKGHPSQGHGKKWGCGPRENRGAKQCLG